MPIPIRETEPDAALQVYLRFLLDHHLDALAAENLNQARLLEVPLMRLAEGYSEEQLLASSRTGVQTFLLDLEAGRALDAYVETLRRWEAGEIPGLPRDAIEPGDMVLAFAAQKQAILAFLPHYTDDAATTRAIAQGLEAYYIQAQNAALNVFTRLREAAAVTAARAEAEVARRTEELKLLNGELVAQRNFAESLIQHLPGAFAYLSPELEYLQVNLRYCELFGRSREELLGTTLAQHFPGMDTLLRNVVATGRGHTAYGYHFVYEDARRRHDSYWDYTVHPTFDEANRLVGVAMLAFDATDRVLAELNLERRTQELEQANQRLTQLDRAKDEFLSVISHELRTPLNFIMGFASILDDGLHGPLTPEQRGSVGKILAGTDRMLLLVDDLLDFARMRAGTFQLTPEPCDYATLINEVLASLQPLANAKRLRLDAEVPADLRPVLDEQRIAQVLTNLVGNAIKFTDAGSVSLRAYAQDGVLVTEVRDTGIGIAADNIPKLFTRFQQLDMSATRKAGGTGLGLAICKALVEGHGGSIGVESSVGMGSTFQFTVPFG